MKTFELHRDVDVSGVSGLGIVAQGVEFDPVMTDHSYTPGVCVVHWLGEHRTTTVHPSMDTVRAVHCHGGATRIVMTGAPYERGMRDAVQDRCEGAWWGSVGGRSCRPPEQLVAPAYITPAERDAYLDGYQAQMDAWTKEPAP